jgi:hypothetical protein
MIKDFTLHDLASGRCRYCGASADMDCYCDYFFSKIKKSKGCWLWTGNKIGSHKIEYGYMNNGMKAEIEKANDLRMPVVYRAEYLTS